MSSKKGTNDLFSRCLAKIFLYAPLLSKYGALSWVWIVLAIPSTGSLAASALPQVHPRFVGYFTSVAPVTSSDRTDTPAVVQAAPSSIAAPASEPPSQPSAPPQRKPTMSDQGLTDDEMGIAPDHAPVAAATRTPAAVLATWRCAGDTVYSLTVTPRGTFKGEGDKINSFGFTVQLVNFDQYLLNRSKALKNHWVMTAPESPPDDVYWNNELLSFDDVNNFPIPGLEKVISPFEQSVDISKTAGRYTKIKAGVGVFTWLGKFYPYIFSLNEDTDGWKFMLSTQYLTTTKEARELTILAAGKPGAMVFSADATSIVTTGDCYKQN
jgi:hypothetical protein